MKPLRASSNRATRQMSDGTHVHTLYPLMHNAGSIFLLLVFVSFAWVPMGCTEQAVPPSMDDVRAGTEPTQEGWDVQFVISEAEAQTAESRPRVEINAGYMATFETPDSTYTEMQSRSDEDPIVAYIYDEAGDTSAVLRSNRLIMHEKERRFEAFGNVVVETGQDKALESEHLVWMEDDRLVRTPGFVAIETPTERIQGYSLVADENLETYTLERVTGQVTVEEDDEPDRIEEDEEPDGIGEDEEPGTIEDDDEQVTIEGEEQVTVEEDDEDVDGRVEADDDTTVDRSERNGDEE